ncbi:flagella basal body P-ring formation protein FlgA [Croceicoccus sp. Ery5]|uniref:flagella basal body P-ring formation protein FlgA n=1 Tax=Croceicoccus sp. Ery5 TaxID=1703340 RepID=UPI001E2E90ED|nr:flagella basal body P-ring formation protein FlgA [Croceicoccus sp. Ery5]
MFNASALIVLLMAAGAPVQDLAALDDRIAQFTGAAIGEEGGAMHPLDRRLKLRPCAAPVDIGWRSDGRDTLILQCPDAGGWRLYMPVRAAAVAADAEAGAIAVQRGDAVSIAVAGQGFTISRPGEALESGAVGDWIKVRPVTEARRRADIMRARITAPGVVSLPSA